MAVRGSISSSVLRSSYGTSRQRISAAMRSRSASVRRPGRAVTSARTWSATSATSPCTPRSTGRWRPGAVGSRSTCTTVAPGPTSARWRVVHMFRAQPHPTTRSDASISSAASGDAKPPDTSSDHGLPANRPLATALVASSAPVCPASSSSSRRAPRAPRPATNTGASAASSSAAKRSITPSAMLMARSAGGRDDTVLGHLLGLHGEGQVEHDRAPVCPRGTDRHHGGRVGTRGTVDGDRSPRRQHGRARPGRRRSSTAPRSRRPPPPPTGSGSWPPR